MLDNEFLGPTQMLWLRQDDPAFASEPWRRQIEKALGRWHGGNVGTTPFQDPPAFLVGTFGDRIKYDIVTRVFLGKVRLLCCVDSFI
jgi:hypothetical protein